MESTAYKVKTEIKTDGTVTQLLQSVNEIENRVRIVGGHLAEETTRRDSLQHEDRRLKAEVHHLAQRERDLAGRVESAQLDAKRLADQSSAVEKNLAQARHETPVLLQHTQMALRAIAGEAAIWEKETAAVDALPSQWHMSLRGEGSLDAEVRALDTEIAVVRAQLEEALAHGQQPPQGSMAAHPLRTQPTRSAASTAALRRMIEEETRVRREASERQAEHIRHTTALEREMAGPMAQLTEVRAWAAEATAQLHYAQNALSAAEAAAASGLCPRCGGQ